MIGQCKHESKTLHCDDGLTSWVRDLRCIISEVTLMVKYPVAMTLITRCTLDKVRS